MAVGVVTVISLVFMIGGLVLKNAILLLASSLSWVIFAFLMYSYTFDNAAINDALLMFGGMMAIISAIMALTMWTRGRPPKMTDDQEQEAYKEKVRKMTGRR